MAMSDPIRERLEATSATHEAGFSGFVHGVALVDLLQIFHYSRRSLTILVEPDATIHLADGEVVHATSGDLEGEPALSVLLDRIGGRIRTTALGSNARTIARPFNFLLLDALRELDESSRDSSEVWSDEPLGTELALPSRASRFPSVPAVGGELVVTACMQLASRVDDVRAVALIDRHERRLVAHAGSVNRLELERECLSFFERPALARLGQLLHASATPRVDVSDWDEARYLGDSGLFFGKSLASRPWALLLCSRSSVAPGLAWTELRQSALMIERILA